MFLDICVDKTKDELGVDIRTLDPRSNQLVYVRCKECHEIFLREFKNTHHKHSCHPCSGYFPYTRLEVKLIHPDARLPFRKRTSDAGYDLYSVENVIVASHSVASVDTGLIVSPPDGAYYTIEGRSSMFRSGIMPYRGIIDGTYQGPLVVMLSNNTDKEYKVSKGDRIAQIIIHKVNHADFIVVDEFSPVYDGRTDNGWGSSGR